MGQKANPTVLRLGIVKDSDSQWFATADYKTFVMQDYTIRNFIQKELARAGVANISIKRKSDNILIDVQVGRPGVIFGKNGIDLNFHKKYIKKLTGKSVNISIIEEKSPDTNAALLGLWVTGQLERRIPFRRAMKMAVQRALKAGAKGVRIACAGRLGGVEIARSEWYREGKVPLHTLRADIDYKFTEANTTYGKIGVKVWVYKGEILKKDNQDQVITSDDADLEETKQD